MADNSSTAATANGTTASAAPTNADGSADFGTSMTDLLPPEIVAAVDKNKAAAAKTQEPPVKADVKTPEAKADVNPNDVIQNLDTKDSKENVDDVNIDNVDDIIAGKTQAKATDDTPEVPDWHDTDEYKALVKKVGFVNGIKNDDFDKVIKAVIDKKVIETSAYTTGLEEKVTKSKQTEETLKTEIDRLKNIEKDAFFDNLEETKTKYGEPMNSAAKQMQQILSINGVNVDINKILLAKNVTEFTNLLKGENLDDSDTTQVRNLWRSYQESHRDYTAAKTDARVNLKKHMSSNIPEETVKKIMGNTIAEAMKKDARFTYIKEGIAQDEYPEEVTQVLSRAQNNFANIVQALSNPIDSSRNAAWLESLSAFTLDASHNAKEAAKLPEVTKQLNEKVADLKKLAVAYTKLMNSSKGINGANGISRSNGTNTSSTDDQQSKDQKAAELKKIIDGTGDVNSFMGFK